MLNSTTTSKLYAIRQMEPWCAYLLTIGLSAVLFAAKLPTWAQVPFATAATKCLIKVKAIFVLAGTIKRALFG